MEGTFMTQGAPQHGQDSLPSLPTHEQSDTRLTAHIASRFHVNLPTTRLSSHATIAVNTYNSSTKGPNGQKEGSAMGAAEDLASRAWARLGARGENQAVVFLGESGSGKTTLRSHFLSSILNLSSTPNSAKLSFAAFVFDTLTTTKTATTPIASKSGLFYELQYDTSSSLQPTLIGGKLLDHRLERSRIASVPTGERSFHVLYYLLAGTGPSEKAHLGLESHGLEHMAAGTRASIGSSQKRWRYLGHPTQLKVGINDVEGFQHFKTALRKLEFAKHDVAEICQMLATILHIGQLEFETSKSTTPAGDESGGYGAEGGEDITTVKNRETLEIVAAFLGVSTEDLQTSLGYKTKILHRERVTVMLDPRGARENADELARTLYSLLVAHVMEGINSRMCAAEEAVGNTISIVDFPGFAVNSATGSSLDQLLSNAAQESLYHFTLQSFFEKKADLFESEEIDVPPTSYFDNSDALKGLLKPGNGLLSILDDQMRRGRTDDQFLDSCRKRFDNKNPAIEVSAASATLPGSNFPTRNAHQAFTVRHFAGEVEYAVDGLLEENSEIVSNDLMNLVESTRNPFVRSLFKQDALQATYHKNDRSAIVQATLSSKPMRQPSMAQRRNGRGGGSGGNRKAAAAHSDEDLSDSGSRKPTGSRTRGGKKDLTATQGAAAEFLTSLDNIIKSISSPDTNPYFMFCVKPNDRRIANQFDSKCVRAQLQTLGIAEMSQRLRNVDFSVFLPFSEFLGLSDNENLFVGSDREKVETILDDKRWPTNEARIGSTGVLLSERCWSTMARIGNPAIPSRGFNATDGAYDGDRLGANESKTNLLLPPSPNRYDKSGTYLDTKEIDTRSDAGASAFNSGDMFRDEETREQMVEKGNDKKLVEVDDVVTSGSRKRWLFIVWLLTFWCPDILIRLIGRIPRKDVRMAWREKLAINLLIWGMCGFVVFFIVFLPQLICPTQHIYSSGELSDYNGQDGNDAYVSMRGVVFDLGKFNTIHYPKFISDKDLLNYAGKDATNLFPIQVSAVCKGKDGSINDRVSADYQGTNYTGQTTITSGTDLNRQYHDFRWGRTYYQPTWLTGQMLLLEKNYFKGRVAWPAKYIQKQVDDESRTMGYINNRVYDLTNYLSGAAPLLCPQNDQNCTTTDSSIDTQYMDLSVVNLFQSYNGQDLSQRWQSLDIDSGLKSDMQVCLDNLFFVGYVDTRDSTQCLFARYLLLAVSILLVSVIGFKFLAALQFGKKNIPENLDKFVICTVPAYTEDEESLRRAIDSAARMRYDDKRKLLVIICDGMIIGQGNDRPTPRIVLDILGVPEAVDPDPLSFESLGEGMKQHNMGKVYSGLYEVQGHIVPFLVLVKIGKPSEVSRPGNRGKRDSQMLLMRFLNRVHYNLPMNPLELEMHHQIRNIIGVNPTFYEFLFQIDADTVVAPDSATRMISAFLHDTRLIAVCGETALTNAKSSFVTMMQVYEYYISHNLTKAFESLFGSVTCLPGCFSMYRIRAAETGKPLFVSREIVEAYQEIRVDTLHMKNLLHLGEDRYLTTLLLKHHSKYKTKYIFRAHAWTIAPDSWKVFMSQRRRWINSTVHNLVELIPLQQLCGFCCFSMRFVVFLDLMSTIVQPVVVGYIVYIIVLVATDAKVVPITAFILLGAIYGLQAIIFILRRKWEMIGWMLIYLAATPIFACGLPLYSFWHMDDFSWGNTRVVNGEKGRQIVVSDEGKFDPKSIPRKRWEEYQAELWEAQTQRDETDADARSVVSGISYATKSAFGIAPARSNYDYATPGYGNGGPRSDYGFPNQYLPPSRPMTNMGHYADAPPRYASSTMSLSQLHPAGTSPQPTGYEMTELRSGNQSMVGGMTGNMHGADQPSDDALLAEIRDILSKADLMTVTKKSVVRTLEQRFGVTLEARKMYIGSATEAVLGGQL